MKYGLITAGFLTLGTLINLGALNRKHNEDIASRYISVFEQNVALASENPSLVPLLSNSVEQMVDSLYQTNFGWIYTLSGVELLSLREDMKELSSMF